ncbi:MAG: hypothetical protein ACYCPT_13705 [Acidimicrobiales bacterium]
MASRLTDYEAALKHKYRAVPGGPYLPGVTSIIDVTDKPGMMWKAAELAVEAVMSNSRRKKPIVAKHRAWLLTARGNTEATKRKIQLGTFGTDNEVFAHWARGDFQRQWNAKAELGQRVHTVAEKWSRGEDVDVQPDEVGYVDALEAFHRDYKPKFKLVECIVVNPELEYGGRFDAISELDGPLIQGNAFLDYKTGRDYVDSLAKQFIGYMDALLASYDDAGRLLDPKPLPEVTTSVGVYLHDDGTYHLSQPFEKITQEQARRGFRACLELFKAEREIEAALKASASKENEDE